MLQCKVARDFHGALFQVPDRTPMIDEIINELFSKETLPILTESYELEESAKSAETPYVGAEENKPHNVSTITEHVNQSTLLRFCLEGS